MSLMGHIVVFAISWWLILFVVLPIGVKTPEEMGLKAQAGTPESAPVHHGLRWKMLVTTLAALVVWGIFCLCYKYNLVSIR